MIKSFDRFILNEDKPGKSSGCAACDKKCEECLAAVKASGVKVLSYTFDTDEVGGTMFPILNIIIGKALSPTEEKSLSLAIRDAMKLDDLPRIGQYTGAEYDVPKGKTMVEIDLF